MIIYSVLVIRTIPFTEKLRTRLVLCTLDLGQAVKLAKEANTLGFPFDTEGDHVGVYKMEAGVPLPASRFNDVADKQPYPVIYWREKDKGLEWVDGWATEKDRLECLSAAA